MEPQFAPARHPSPHRRCGGGRDDRHIPFGVQRARPPCRPPQARRVNALMSNRRPRIRVINPNSNDAVTRGIDDAVAPLRFTDGPEIVCSTLADGPFGVETQEHVESVALPLRRLVEADNASDAFVIACYSDPGLHVCREGTTRPVFGIAECGVLTALARAERFGVIAILQRSITRHMRYLRQMGLTDRLAGERPLELSVAESARENTLPRMIEVGRALRDEDGGKRR